MADCEFDDVKCTAFDGKETEFYNWAIKLKMDPWEIRTEDIRGDKFLFFRWHNRIGRGDDFEVSMLVDLDKGQYDVCNVVPFMCSQLTPREYNEKLERFVNEILTPFNQDNGNILHVVYEKCGGILTYDSGLPDLNPRNNMADCEFDDVKCTAFDGQETEFYNWAIKLSKDPWTVIADEFQDIKYLRFRWNEGRSDGFEVDMKVDPETGHYDVCNVVPLAISQFTPREYNENLERFVNEILTPFNQDNGNILHVVYEKCGGILTYDSGLPDLNKCWTEKHTMDMMEHLKCELFHARLELMEDVLNRHTHEIISRESHAAVSHQIVEIINQQLLRPGDCDLMMAAQCFVGMCMKKMVMSTPPTNMFDDFLTDEYRAHLSKLIGVDSWRLEGAIQIGAVRTNFYSLYDEGVRNGTEH